IIAHWPEAKPVEGWEEQKVADFALLQEAVRLIRNARTEKKLSPGQKIGASIAAGDKLPIFESQRAALCALAGIDPDQLTLQAALAEKPQGQTALVVAGVEIFLSLAGLVDETAERARLEQELTEINSQIERLAQLLNSPFAQKAPAAVVDKERQKLAAYQETAAKLKQQLGG
ncbi:MAG TPA: valine--tRNA ligase, partial [Anaerolineaceae bacterium]|nr:valine--tRNA ligase [Anaerolineaceae bacterium]